MLILTIVFYMVLVLQIAAMCLLFMEYRYSTCTTPTSIGLAAIIGGLPWIIGGCVGMAVEIYFSDYWVDWRRINRRVAVRLVNPDQITITV